MALVLIWLTVMVSLNLLNTVRGWRGPRFPGSGPSFVTCRTEEWGHFAIRVRCQGLLAISHIFVDLFCLTPSFLVYFFDSFFIAVAWVGNSLFLVCDIINRWLYTLHRAHHRTSRFHCHHTADCFFSGDHQSVVCLKFVLFSCPGGVWEQPFLLFMLYLTSQLLSYVVLFVQPAFCDWVAD